MIFYYQMLINVVENIIHIILKIKKKSKYSEIRDYNNIHLIKKKINNILIEEQFFKIKINSHPCAGKSRFIKKYEKKYPNFIFYDLDYFKGENKTSMRFKKALFFLPFFKKVPKMKNRHSVLFGSNEHLNQNENIIYIHVIPNDKHLIRNVIFRNKIFLFLPLNISRPKWYEVENILKSRNRLIKYILDNESVFISDDFKSIFDYLNSLLL